MKSTSGSSVCARNSLITMVRYGFAGAGSAAPGEPLTSALAAQALGLASPYDGRASTSEWPNPSGDVGYGKSPEYFASNNTALLRLRRRTVPELFCRLLVNPPFTPLMP